MREFDFISRILHCEGLFREQNKCCVVDGDFYKSDRLNKLCLYYK